MAENSAPVSEPQRTSGRRPARSRRSETETPERHESQPDSTARSQSGPRAAGESEPNRSGDDGGDGTRRRKRRRRRRRPSTGSETAQTSQAAQRKPPRKRSGPQTDRPDSRSRSRSRRPQTAPQNGNEVTGEIEGVLELHPKNYGFLRDPTKNYVAQETDPFVSSSLIEKHNLREGVLIHGGVGPGTKGQGPRLKSIETIDGRSLEDYQKIRNFEDLTPINPFEQIKLEVGPKPVTMRVMDLLTPIGKGQRALIVAPPRTGKTMLLQEIAESVTQNHPEVHLMVMLIDERPEEVTEMQRNVKGEVIASSMDRDVESHVRLSQLIVERAKRLAEAGTHVFILMDSITRMARAFNKWVGNSGRTQTGGLDIKALDIPKKLFGSARRFDEGGSLTVVATALIDTGSRMDAVIFEEFKGTGNSELVLDRKVADKRIFPAMDILKSGTRKEDLLVQRQDLQKIFVLRRILAPMGT
ncbi:MAG: transcription termination factor Rho, partial [Planctomycetaceae bacterium]|nr:transcription termination factor Rho [Planctomycetaceae bacterium]